LSGDRDFFRQHPAARKPGLGQSRAAESGGFPGRNVPPLSRTATSLVAGGGGEGRSPYPVRRGGGGRRADLGGGDDRGSLNLEGCRIRSQHESCASKSPQTLRHESSASQSRSFSVVRSFRAGTKWKLSCGAFLRGSLARSADQR